MNIILTSKCSKGCSFCFTDDDGKKENNEMLFTDVIKLCDTFLTKKGGPRSVNLLGGEPTQYSNFLQVYREIFEEKYHQYDRTTNLISNLLCNHKIIKEIANISKESTYQKGLLANGMELDENNRIKLFKDNIETLYNESSLAISLAITLADNKDFEYHKNYFHFLDTHGIFKNISYVRIGLDLSNINIINNKKYGNIIRYYYENLPENIRIFFDCQVPPCVFSEEEWVQYSNREPSSMIGNIVGDGLFETSSCTFMPTDILPDGSVLSCYQLDSKVDILPSIYDFKNMKEVKKTLKTNYNKYISKRETPEECLSCEHYLVSCPSLCGGCR